MSVWAMIKEDCRVILEKDPAIKSRLELIFNYPGLMAVVHYRLAHAMYERGFMVLARMLMGITQYITGVDIHPAAVLGRRLFIDHGIGVVIGETVCLGDDVTIYPGVNLGAVNFTPSKKRHPTIGNGVVIGTGAKVLGDIVVGAGAKVGANAVVVRSVPENATAVGIPARIITHDEPRDSTSEHETMIKSLIERIQKLEAQLTDKASQDSLNACLKKLEELEMASRKD